MRLCHTHGAKRQHHTSSSLTISKCLLRDNLYWELINLRKKEPRKLWIDALCIDQSSHEDKEYQIRLMDYIYTRAETVLIWLGKYPAENPPWTLTKGSNKKDRGSWMAWYTVLRRWVCENPYWRRLWIIQEIGLARNLVVHISRQSLEWEDFIKELCLEKQSPGFLTEYPGALLVQKLHNKRKTRNCNSNRLESLLEDFQEAECAEASDKIYGLLGFASDCLLESIEVDYQKSRFQLYAEVVDFFNRRQYSKDQGCDVVDRSLKMVRFSQLVSKCLMSPAVPEAPPFYTGPLIVEATGAFVDEIRHLGPTYKEMMSSSAANKKFKISIHECCPDATRAVWLREAYEAYYDRLLKMSTEEIGKVCGFQPQTRYSRAFRTNTDWNGDGRGINREMIDVTKREELNKPSLENPKQNVDGCRMFLGDRETMGLAPPEAQLGDVVCLFWKTDVAALLRKETSGPYRIVGRLNISTARVRGTKDVYENWMEPQKEAKIIVVQMAIATLNELTRQGP
ncbi:heterokaryon incompatibility protein-domain-containing protein [Leptodontidium sp. MPI-SDFR-AT-0119]|nr:heterokaryon incompatibility protein-domain-containing protein [Leptodontidium sp. MPI-SDFR-AT-0119]